MSATISCPEGGSLLKRRTRLASPVRASRHVVLRARPVRPSQPPLKTHRCTAREARVRVHATKQDVAADAASSGSVAAAKRRAARLKNMVYLRRLYRNFVRAEGYGATSLGVYYKPTDEEREHMTDEERVVDDEAKQQQALNVLADMHLTADQLKSDLRNVLPLFEDLLRGVPWPDPDARPGRDGGGSRAVQAQRSKAARLEELTALTVSKLLRRVDAELPLLPFATAREARSALGRILAPVGEDSEGAKLSTSYSGRLEMLEKVAGQFFAGSVRPTVKKAKDVFAEQGINAALTSSGRYVSGLWRRLNGQGRGDRERLPHDLPIPPSSKADFQRRVETLSMQISKLEKDLVDASKSREQRLRSASIERRALMAFEMRDMDQEVMDVGRELALCSLEVQVEYIYMALEDEVRQVLDSDLLEDTAGAVGRQVLAAPRRGSTQELAILVAEYSLLAERLAELWQVFQDKERFQLFKPAFDEELKLLAAEVPDMRARIGIPDQDVFGGSGLSLRKAQLEIRSSVTKLSEAVNFFGLGMKMLGTDIAYASRLFGRAVLGNTLKPREVSALRRTIRDVFTFVPFTIILIIPMTPLGHVLVFGFIQRYFPNFFPSQFNTRRQEMVKRYEELRLKLEAAQEAAFEREEEEELVKTAAELARLTVGRGSLEAGGTLATLVSAAQADLAGNRPVRSDLRLLQQEVEDANYNALTASGDEEDDVSDNVAEPDARNGNGSGKETKPTKASKANSVPSRPK